MYFFYYFFNNFSCNSLIKYFEKNKNLLKFFIYNKFRFIIVKITVIFINHLLILINIYLNFKLMDQ